MVFTPGRWRENFKENIEMDLSELQSSQSDRETGILSTHSVMPGMLSKGLSSADIGKEWIARRVLFGFI